MAIYNFWDKEQKNHEVIVCVMDQHYVFPNEYGCTCLLGAAMKTTKTTPIIMTLSGAKQCPLARGRVLR